MIASGSKRFSTSGRLMITIELTRAGRQMLKRARKLRITVHATYTPTGSTGVSAIRAVTLRR